MEIKDAFGNAVKVDGDYVGCIAPNGNLLTMIAIPYIRTIHLQKLPNGGSGIQVAFATSDVPNVPEAFHSTSRFFFDSPTAAKQLADAIEDARAGSTL